MPEAPLPSLLDLRLVIVTGKGGTGKTTVAATLARAAARAGRRVLVAELAEDEPLARLLAPDGPPVGHSGRELEPGLTAMRIEPFAALEEYLSLQIGLRGVVRRVLANRGFHQLMEASPGWRELITLGKVWHLEQMREDGRPRFDLLIIDAPATGHGVALLNVPRVVVSAVRAGPLRRHSQLVREMVEDPKRTLLLPVALPEELPTRETAELVQRVRDEVGVRVDRIVVNGVIPPPFPPGLDPVDAVLSRLPPGQGFGSLPRARTLALCASFLRARHERSRSYVALLRELTRLPLLQLPYLTEGLEEGAGLTRLEPGLLAEPEPA